MDGVILDSIETADVMELGPELVALKAWEELRFTPTLEALGMNPSAIATAQLMVSNRLIEPLSEWAMIDWSHRTAIPELLNIRLTKSAKDRLYRTSDDLMIHRKDIEAMLRERELFFLSRSVILYDLTNSHFEGFCASNPKAKHGKNATWSCAAAPSAAYQGGGHGFERREALPRRRHSPRQEH